VSDPVAGGVPGELQDCRSESGITVGLVDALISICRILCHRDLSLATEALTDLRSDDDVRHVMEG